MSPWMIFLITRLDCISSVSGMLSIISMFFCIILTACFLIHKFDDPEESQEQKDSRDYNMKLSKTGLRFVLPIFLLSLSCFCLTPSTKQACVIFLAPKIINNDQVQSIGQNGLELIDEQVKLWLDEIKNKK